MSLLLRLKPSPLKQLYPSLRAPFSTSGRLSGPTREEKLQALKSGEEIAKTTPLGLFLSQFKGKKKAAGRAKYAQLSAEEKKVYRDKASNENKKQKDRKAALLMRELAAGLPKKVTNPYIQFAKENYTQKANATGERVSGVARALAQEWSSLSESQKQTYKEKCVDSVKQYEVDFRKWAKTLSADERVLFGTKGQKYLTKAQRAELWTPPLTPRRAFLKAEFASVDMKGLDRDDFRKTFANTVKEASQKWNVLSQEQRQKYSSVH